MIKRDEENNYVNIQCDKCEVMALPAAELLAGHGLVNMGWYCSGGTHICPAHEHPASARVQLPLVTRDTMISPLAKKP